MSFFKDFKDDLSLAVNELLPGEDLEGEDELNDSSDMMVNTLEGELDIESELSKLDGLLEDVQDAEGGNERKHTEISSEEPVLEKLPEPEPDSKEETGKPEPEPLQAPKHSNSTVQQPLKQSKSAVQEEKEVIHFSFDSDLEDTDLDAEIEEEPVIRSIHQNNRNVQKSTIIKEEIPMNEEMTKDTSVGMEEELAVATPEITDEVSIITEGTTIKGNLSTTGSFSISGRVEGNVQCNGKLEVTGTIKGNSSSSEIFSDAAKIEGEIVSTGTVKIGLGSVVVGNITATSAVVAGAVKGDIDVQGPVVVDTSAVIVGNIKSRSVQINNGAVIEGFCSQCYADIDVESLFGDNKKGK